MVTMRHIMHVSDKCLEVDRVGECKWRNFATSLDDVSNVNFWQGQYRIDALVILHCILTADSTG